MVAASQSYVDTTSAKLLVVEVLLGVSLRIISNELDPSVRLRIAETMNVLEESIEKQGSEDLATIKTSLGWYREVLGIEEGRK